MDCIKSAPSPKAVFFFPCGVFLLFKICSERKIKKKMMMFTAEDAKRAGERWEAIGEASSFRTILPPPLASFSSSSYAVAVPLLSAPPPPPPPQCHPATPSASPSGGCLSVASMAPPTPFKSCPGWNTRHQLQGFGPQGHRQLQGHRADGQPGQQRARRDHRGMPPAFLPAGECWVVDFGGGGGGGSRRSRLLSRRVSYPPSPPFLRRASPSIGDPTRIDRRRDFRI